MMTSADFVPLSVVIPALNEADRIRSCVDAVRAAGAGVAGLEILVVDGDPAGNTVKCLDGEGVRCLRSERGRGRQMNAGALAARGRALMFLHADARLPDGGAEQALRVLAAGHDLGAFDLAIDSDDPWLKLVARVASWRSRLTRIPYGDQAIFMTRAAFERLGGFDEGPFLEDVDLMRRARRLGLSVGFADAGVRVSDRRWRREGRFYCTLRNWLTILLYNLGVPPAQLVRLYRS